MILFALALVAVSAPANISMECTIWYDPDGSMDERKIEPDRVSRINVSYREGRDRSLRDIFVVPVVSDVFDLTAQRSLRWHGVGTVDSAILQAKGRFLEIDRRTDGRHALKYRVSNRVVSAEGSGVCSTANASGDAK